MITYVQYKIIEDFQEVFPPKVSPKEVSPRRFPPNRSPLE